MEVRNWNWKWIVRGLHVVGCMGGAFCGLWGYIAYKVTFLSLLLNFYLIAFSCLLFTAEVHVPIRWLQFQFRFLQSFSGRTMTLLFIGSLCFVFTTVQNVIFGIYIIVVFCVDVWLGCALRPDFINEEREQIRSAAQAIQADAKATVSSGVAQGVSEAAREGMDESIPTWARGVDNTKTNSVSKGQVTTPATDFASGGASTAPSWARGIEPENDTAVAQPPAPAVPSQPPAPATDSVGETNNGDDRAAVPAWAAGIVQQDDPHANPFR